MVKANFKEKVLGLAVQGSYVNEKVFLSKSPLKGWL